MNGEARPGLLVSAARYRARRALCADMDGFSLHAAVRFEGRERQRVKRLCRYITRPALAYERVQYNVAGQVLLELKTA